MPQKNFKSGALPRAALACLLFMSTQARACDECGEADEAPPEAKPATARPAAPAKKLSLVKVQGAAPTSLPTNIPTTLEGVTREDIARTVNATDAEDALKYFPSLLVRKRYIGDYNHAILSSRASGTGNSARSAVYADGMLLSNYLGNGVGGLSFPPRWGLVTPEEIERVDVMYGPFSAAYPGNSVGAVVDYQTRMPSKFEAHARLSYQTQNFDLYETHSSYRAWQRSASLGDRDGAFAWWIHINRTDSSGQPLTFATRLASNGVAGSGGTTVTGAILQPNSAGANWYLLGAATQYDTVQDHAKIKLAYDISPQWRASYVYGSWRNASDGNSQSWLRDANGQPVYSGAINIGGVQFSGSQALGGGDFGLTREQLRHSMQGLSLKSRTGAEWDWELAGSRYAYGSDLKRQNAAGNPQPAAWSGGAGTLADGSGSGWNTLAVKAVWRPSQGRHVVDLGLQQDRYALRYKTRLLSGDYLSDSTGTLASNSSGDTRLQSAYAQDAWLITDDWKAVLGLRAERWAASNGRTDFSSSSALTHARRTEGFLSPKAALSWQWTADSLIKASVGRAVRMPTVAELYGATATTNSQYINDANLKPEKSWTSELSLVQSFGALQSRLTWFAETTHDAIYSQTLFDAAANRNVSRVQNVAKIATTGLEATQAVSDWLLRGLDLSGSLTYTDSRIKANQGFVATAGDTLGKWQPNIPRWRATLQASYTFDARWSASLAGRYSGRQYRTLNNADVNGVAYMGVSKVATADARLVYRPSRHWTAALGVDNLNNDQYWNFHPYPQRSYHAELRFDL